MAYDIPQLLAMTETELDNLFSSSLPGDIPNGEAQGTAIVASGTKFSPEIASFVNHFIWQGKTFDAKKGVLTNRISVCRSSRLSVCATNAHAMPYTRGYPANGSSASFGSSR